MKPGDPNVLLLETVARQLDEELREALVFVGGAVVGLLITDPAAPSVRPTEDVDLIVQTLALADYRAIERRLIEQGFTHDLSADAPICRWRIGPVAVDVMPTLESVLGFANRWYPLAIDSAQRVTLPSRTPIRLIAAPAFIATKLDAFDGRGQGDHLFSHDLGDAISVIDGRDALLSECRSAPDELRTYLSRRWADLLNTPSFLEALPGHLPGDGASQQRLPELLDKLGGLARLA
jgi:hypothetical protein